MQRDYPTTRIAPYLITPRLTLILPFENLLFDILFSRGGLPCTRRRKVDVPGVYLTGLNWNAKKRNEWTIILGEREKERERRECEHPPVSGGVYPAGTPTRPPPADVFIVLVQPRNSHSAATRNFAHYYYYYYYYSIEVPFSPLFHSREKDLPRGFGSRGGVERLSRTMISREREKTGRETAWLSRTTYKSAPIATLDLSRAFALVFHFDVHVCKKEKKDW